MKEGFLLISLESNSRFSNIIANIERDYKEIYGNDSCIAYIDIYKECFDERLSRLCSNLHYQLVEVFRKLNECIKKRSKYFNAELSRVLINSVELSVKFIKACQNAGEKVNFVKYYDTILNKCADFIKEYKGSMIPEDFEEILLYYELPIFECLEVVQFHNVGSVKCSLQIIGEGSYATVYGYIDERYQKRFALKRAKKEISKKDLERFYLEFDIMKKLNSPYILEVYSIDKENKEYIMEYADTSLLKYICDNNQKLRFEERKGICLQIIKGFEYLSNKNIFHRDISPKNVLIKLYDDAKVVKIADFGIVKINESFLTSETTEIRGSFNDYTGLQRVGFNNYDFQFEGFALCKLLYFVLTGRTTNFNKFEYLNLKEFMDKGINPDLLKRFKNIEELKQSFLNITTFNSDN